MLTAAELKSQEDDWAQRREAMARLRKAYGEGQQPQQQREVQTPQAPRQGQLKKAVPTRRSSQQNEFGNRQQQQREALEEDRAFARQLELVQKVAHVAGFAAKALGQRELGESLGGVGQAAGEAGQAAGQAGAGVTRRTLANKRGDRAAKRAYGDKETQKAQGTGGKAAALSGGVSALLQGQGAADIAKSVASSYWLWLVFGSLFTVVWFVPALAYLNIHYIMSELRHNSWFTKMRVSQKWTLLGTDLVSLIAILVLIGFISWVNEKPDDACALFGGALGWITSKIKFCSTFKHSFVEIMQYYFST